MRRFTCVTLLARVNISTIGSLLHHAVCMFFFVIPVQYKCNVLIVLGIELNPTNLWGPVAVINFWYFPTSAAHET